MARNVVMVKHAESGPLAKEGALIQLLEQVDQAVASKAKIVLGGKRIKRAGSFMEATILTNITPGNPACREECFGPVVLMFRAKNEDEAVALANATRLGLGASILTRDAARGECLPGRIDTGRALLNQPTWTAPELPFVRDP